MTRFTTAFNPNMDHPIEPVTLNAPDFNNWEWSSDSYQVSRLPRIESELVKHQQDFLKPFIMAFGAGFVEENLLFDYGRAFLNTEEDHWVLEPNEVELEVKLYPKGTDPKCTAIELLLQVDYDAAGDVNNITARVRNMGGHSAPYASSVMGDIIKFWDEGGLAANA